MNENFDSQKDGFASKKPKKDLDNIPADQRSKSSFN